MAKEPKSPQEKKRLELTRGHFTFGLHSSRAFPKVWKQKKTFAARELRRKSNDLLSQAKTGIGADDAASISNDVTPSRIKKFVVRKRLRKTGTVTVGEKVKLKLQRRKEFFGRRVERIKADDDAAASAIATLSALGGENLVIVARRAARLCGGGDVHEWMRLRQSNDPVDQALCFLESIVSGINSKMDAVQRSPDLDKALTAWVEKANRIIAREKRPIVRKAEEKQHTEKKLKTVLPIARRQAQS